MIKVQIKVEKETIEMLTAFGKSTGYSLSEVLTNAVDHYLNINGCAICARHAECPCDYMAEGCMFFRFKR